MNHFETALCGECVVLRGVHALLWPEQATLFVADGCFVIGARRAILRAFGSFTGLATRQTRPRGRLVVMAGTRLFPLPH